jgi:hypothetical protein
MSLCLINIFLTLPLDGRASGFMSGYFNPTEKVLPLDKMLGGSESWPGCSKQKNTLIIAGSQT